jgi:hypothetical protein
MQSPPGLTRLVRAGVSCQRQHLQRFIVERDGRIHCVCCEEKRVPHSGWSYYNQDNVFSHFQQHHPDVEVYPAQDYVEAAAAFKRERELATQPPITLKFHKVESKPGVDQALRILEKHPGLPLHLFGSPVFLAPWSDRKGVNADSITTAVVQEDAKNMQHIRDVVFKRKLVGGQVDGAKDVNSDKTLGEAVVTGGRFYCWDVERPPTGATYDAPYYKGRLQKFVEDVEACGSIMCGITMDNEASLNAGMTLLRREQAFKRIIHNRCTNHTAELLLNDVQHHIPKLQLCMTACHDIVTAVKNNKAYKDALRTSQIRQGVVKPRRLIKSNNTRKWSSGFLMLSRVQELYTHLAALADYVSADEVPKRREWLSEFAPKFQVEVSPMLLEACVRVLYWVYVGEQILQRDVSSVIHAAHVFEELCAIFENRNVQEIQRISPLLLADANVDGLRRDSGQRRDKLSENGVYNLALCMWPLTDNQLASHEQGMDELDVLVDNCWHIWQEKQDVFGSAIPIAFRVRNMNDNVEMDEKRNAFKTAVGEQLTSHMLAQTDRIRNAKDRFTQASNAIFADLSRGAGCPKVERGPVVRDRFKLSDYWLAVQCELPALYPVFLVLNSVCATEAGCERIFSKEGFIHSALRNRMNHRLIVAILRNAINGEAFDGVLNGQMVLDDEDVVDVTEDERSDDDE